MAYATLADVRARAGRLSPAWDQSSTPSDGEIERMIEDIAGELNGYIAALSFTIPVTDDNVRGALRGLNADGALILAVRATFPSGEGPAAAAEILRSAEERYTAGMDLLRAGTHPATLILAGADPDTAGGGSDFWSENPDYGLIDAEERAEINPWLQPEFERGMVL